MDLSIIRRHVVELRTMLKGIWAEQNPTARQARVEQFLIAVEKFIKLCLPDDVTWG